MNTKKLFLILIFFAIAKIISAQDSTTTVSGILTDVDYSNNLQKITETEKEISISANTVEKEIFIFRVLPISESAWVKIYFNDELYENFNIEITPRGFPVSKSFSGPQDSAKYKFSINELLPGSLFGNFTIFTNFEEQIFTAIAGIIRTPHGCFDQVSATTFPNVMAWQYLKQTNKLTPEITQKLKTNIEIGYKKLAAYETNSRGFEWWGNEPHHEVLSAYGLLEFTEMQKVYPEIVDNELIARTKNWLLSRKTGDGNFKNHNGKYGFAGASQTVANAYIVFALAQCNIKDIEKEYQLAKNEALKSLDPYRLGLLTNAAFYLNKNNDFEILLKTLNIIYNENEISDLKIDHSITRSSKNSLQVEATALYLSALLKQENKNLIDIQKTVEFLYASRNGGYFGNTQATVLTLSALTELEMQYPTNSNTDKKCKITINNNSIVTDIAAYQQTIIIDTLQQYLKISGEQAVEIEFIGDSPLPYSFDFKWNTLQLPDSTQCNIGLNIDIQTNTCKTAELVNMKITIRNKKNTPQPMTIAEVGIPAGLNIQTWQIKELDKQNAWDYFEIFNGKLVFYYRELGPNEVKEISLDLKADIPGKYTAPTSSAYLYYTPEFKTWVKGSEITINN